MIDIPFRTASQEEKVRLVSVINKHRETRNHLHKVTFTTLAEYLHILREIAIHILRPLGSRSMLYLAAAVSDFYIPSQEMVGKTNGLDMTIIPRNNFLN